MEYAIVCVEGLHNLLGWLDSKLAYIYIYIIRCCVWLILLTRQSGPVEFTQKNATASENMLKISPVKQ